ncbi:hypothetical protein GCM10008015_25740 [Flavobacterium palustre]|uniref:histidine kinase n=1 Tax=Flavobacterium palustre TaxID=1476463 RepID=A0ABQ1HQ10_9FLAO|nr:ATP-binding protein [Flavobacterium palustre]GGA83775.1 hypothetical protein GCM10008015_25740 [Flavobacterium palustre]
MTKTKLFLIVLYLVFSTNTYSQYSGIKGIIVNSFQKKTTQFKDEINFSKMTSFFEEDKWDSTLVYSTKQLANKKPELNNYCHYIRGIIFFNKKLYRKSKSELLLINENFDLKPMKNLALGNASLELLEFKNALHYYKEVEKLPDNIKKPILKNVNNGIGTTFIFLKEFDNAEKYFLKNIAVDEAEKNYISLNISYTNLANCYYEEDKNDLAFKYFEKTYYLSQKINDYNAKQLASFNMAVIEEDRGNLKKALAFRKEAEKWNDSLNDQNKVWAVADFEKKFAVSQKQKQIKVLEIENELKNNQRNWLFFSAMSLLALLTAGIYLYAQKVKNAKIILLQKNKLDELNTTKDQLFSIVSHDLRSSVNALKNSNAKLTATLESKNYEELNQLIIQNSGIANGTYSLLDNLLHWAMLQTKQLYFNKESVHLYSIVQQIEYNYKPLLLEKSIDFENLVSKSSFIFVDLDSLKIILRNLLDNAIKFSNEKGKISFATADTQNGFWQLIIKDNGIGMTQNTLNELLNDSELLSKKNNSEIIGTGLGFQLCKQMIKKNSGILAIESEINKGTTITLSFPKTAQNG